jgi:hypothetical protein
LQDRTESVGIDLIKFALDTLQRRSQNTSEINRVLARVADEKGDGLAACRHFKRAFKSAADFSYQDYKLCLKNLLKKGDLGTAKIVCQKGARKFPELSADYDKIKQARNGQRGIGSTPPLLRE